MFKELNAQSNLPKIEKKILDFWEKNGIFEKSIKIRDRENSFVFYEGPPTANGRPGIHHVISRTIKDFFCRYKAMNGYYVPRKAGWDTHGLPVEIEIEKKLNITNKEQILEFGVENFNRECRESVLKYTREWEDLTKRIGFWVNLEEAYLTYSNDYIESVWWIIKQFYDAGLIYKDYKVLPYCPRCGTPLSSHEVAQGYKNVTEKSVYVRFRLKDQSNHFILAWTTTPWTLPGNVALAVGSDIDYIKVKQTLLDGSNEFLYLAKDLSELIVGDYEIVEHLKGHEMAGWKYEPLFQSIPDQNVEKAWFIAEADFVTTNEGTGIVHTAVMYGEDDYELGSRLGLPRHHTVDENGRFTSDVKEFEGIFVKDAEKNIIKNLRDRGLLYLSSDYTHSYPHCWRCDSPLLYYARDSWYLKTTAFKDKLVDINDTINWYPKEVGEKRFGKWLGNNVDWALSRDRFWGTPLNIWICVSCGETDCIGSVEELRKKSTNVPQNLDLHKPFVDDIITSCKQCGENMERTPEVLDAWFDSGSMPYAQWHYPFENEELFKERFPADFISEGIDQTRGWFYSLHVIASFLFGKMAYKNCVSIELILDKDGQKMSKSKGNVVNPFEILDKFGADTLRWYLLTVNQPWVPLRFDEDGLLEVQRKFFGTLINTYSFFAMYANIDNFDVNADQVSLLKRSELDRWIISRLNTVISQINDHLTRYDPTRAGRIISNFVIDDLSNWYIRRSRRRFWKEEMGDDKLSAYQTLYEVLTTVAHLIAPFAPFIADSIYKNLTSTKKGASESVHLADYPKFDASKINENLETEMYLSQTIVGLARSLRNTSQIKVRQPLKKLIVVTKSKEQIKAIRKMEILIKEEINVHTIEFIEDETLLITKKGKPNFKTIGPKFGKNAKLIAEAIRSFNAETIASLEKMETIDVKLGDKTYTVEFSDVEIIEEEMEEVQMGIDKDITIALDTHITAELQKEGFAREFVNRVQNMRKEAEFEVTDRIRVFFQSGLKLKEAIEFKKQYIQKEILAAEISDTFHKGEYSKEWKVNSESVNIGIERVV